MNYFWALQRQNECLKSPNLNSLCILSSLALCTRDTISRVFLAAALKRLRPPLVALMGLCWGTASNWSRYTARSSTSAHTHTQLNKSLRGLSTSSVTFEMRLNISPHVSIYKISDKQLLLCQKIASQSTHAGRQTVLQSDCQPQAIHFNIKCHAEKEKTASQQPTNPRQLT